VTGLLVAEQLAGAADLHVVAGEREADAELAERFDGFKALERVALERVPARHHEVRVGLVVRAADPPAQLVQLRQAEGVGAVDDDGIGGRHVDAALDDGGAHQ
jgi:hypothetical protein